MADDVQRIRVEILATAEQFRRELDSAINKLGGPGGLKQAIKDVPNEVKVDIALETAGAHTKLGKLRDAIRDTQAQIERDSSFGLDTGAARLKLDALERKADQVKRKIAEDAALSAIGEGGRGGGGLLASLPSSIGPVGSGGAGLALPAAGAAAGLAGSATAIAGSAGAAALGAGALGVGGLGILATGLGSIAAVVKPAITGLTEVMAATEKLSAAQANYGPASKQARQAQQDLNTVIGEAPAGTKAAAEGIKDLQDAWEPLAKPAQVVFFKIVTEGLGVLKGLLPTVASIAKTSLEAIDKGLQPVFKGLSSPAFKQVLFDLGQAFAKLAPPTIQAFANIFQALANIAVAAAPFVVQLARGFADMTHSWVVATSNAPALRGVIGGLVGQFKSWWELTKAVGGLLVTVFSAGAGQGQSLVNMLTEIVKEWNAWLNTKQGQADMKHFFAESGKLLIGLAEALGPLLKAVAELAIKLIPVATAFVWLAKEIFVTDQIGKAFHETVKAIGDAVKWLVTSPFALLIPVIGQLIGVMKLWELVVGHFGEIWHAVWHGIQDAFAKVLGTLLGGFSTLLGAIASVLRAADSADFAGIFGNKFSKAAKAVEGGQHAIDNFRNTLAPATDASKTATSEIASAHEVASRKIVASWGTALGATKKGIGEINASLLVELKAMNGGKIVPLSQGGPPLSPGLEKALEGKAGGGYIGQPGERGRDEVPAMLGRGEAVLHAGHQAVVNQALANSGMGGGLPQLFASTGGLHYNFAGGGFAGGTGAMGAMVSTANQINSRHYPYLWGGGHNSSFSGPYDCSGAVSAVLHAGGLLGAPEVSGQFESYGLPGPGRVTLYANPTHVYMSLDGRFFGTSGANPGGGAGWFAGGARPGFVVRHVDPSGKPGPIGGGGQLIATPRAKGVGGAIGAVTQGALDKATSAANALLASQGGGTPGAGAGSFTGGQPSENAGNEAIGKAMMTAAGFPAGEWPFLQKLWTKESGWDANSVNASSGAYGIPQALGHGRPFALGDARGQIAWGLRYIRERYGSPAKAWAHEASSNWYAKGGFVGAPRPFAAAGFAASHKPTRAPQVKAPPAAGRPPAQDHKRRGLTPVKVHAGHVLPSALLSELPKDLVNAATNAGVFAREAGAEETAYSHLLDAQRLVPTEALATLTDADVAFMDPGSGPGGQSLDAKGQIVDSPHMHLQPGDQLVNTDGLTTGRFFTEGARAAGGTFHLGIHKRTEQIGQLLGVLGRQGAFLGDEQALDNWAYPRELKAAQQKQARRTRVARFLAKSVAHAHKVKAQITALTTGNLQHNLQQALSKQAIGQRKGELQSHLTSLHDELTAERHHQSELIPIEKDPSYGQSLESQIETVRASLAHEQQLSSAGGTSAAVRKAREALLKQSLQHRLTAIGAENKALGGQSEAVGSGGLLGALAKQISAMNADAPQWLSAGKSAGDSIYNVGKVTAELVAEQLSLNGTTPVQVRSPGSGGEEGKTQQQEALLALVKQQLAQTQQALAISQSQFAVFQGFQPLLQGRLVGSFATGVDRVPRTGPAIVHQGEVILPDPSGPFGNRAAAQARGSDQPIAIELHFDGDSGHLVKLVDARINQRSLRVVADHSGQRSRLMAGVSH